MKYAHLSVTYRMIIDSRLVNATIRNANYINYEKVKLLVSSGLLYMTNKLVNRCCGICHKLS